MEDINIIKYVSELFNWSPLSMVMFGWKQNADVLMNAIAAVMD